MSLTAISNGNSLSYAAGGERRNTEPAWVRDLGPVSPGALR